MDFRELVSQKCAWAGGGARGGIALLSRVRLARNLGDFPFPNRASGSQLEAVSARVLKAASESAALKNAIVKNISELSALDVEFLVERHLVSREFTRKPAGSVIIIAEGGVINIMVNEEDHLRLQVMKPGLDTGGAWRIAERLETEFASAMAFAFSERWGYLTACPTNIGTGLRASVMLHLPMLVISRRIVRVLTRISKSGIAPRGAYGEGSEPSGNLFQISNQFTLGKAEEGIISEIDAAASGVVGEEESAREDFYKKDRKSLEDRVFRAYGILSNARMISSAEALDLLSHLKLGVSLGIIDLGRAALEDLILEVRPAHLQKFAGTELSRSERDEKRAGIIRKKLILSGGEADRT